MNILDRVRLVWSYVRPLLEKNKATILSLIVPLAKDAILAQVKLGTANDVKKSNAIGYITDSLKGLKYDNVGTSMIELGFNLAFQSLKNEGKV